MREARTDGLICAGRKEGRSMCEGKALTGPVSKVQSWVRIPILTDGCQDWNPDPRRTVLLTCGGGSWRACAAFSVPPCGGLCVFSWAQLAFRDRGGVARGGLMSS